MSVQVSKKQYAFGLNSKGEEVYLSRAERYGIPNKIVIDSYQYTFKDQLKGEKFSYRCKSTRCAASLIIDKNEMEKVKEAKGDLNYTISKDHTCLRLLKRQANIEDVLTEKDLDDNGKKAVLEALDKPINWHIQNLIKLDIKVPNKYIQYILFKEREKKYPFEEEFLTNLCDIKIDLELNINNEKVVKKNLPFCFMINKIINPDKKNREEKYEIFTSIYQLKHFSKSNEIYFDINYKTVPTGYQYILSILSYNPEEKKSLPIFLIPMSHKSKLIYLAIFESLESILEDNDVSRLSNNSLTFMCDCQNCLYEALKEYYKGSKINGNYYFYIKSLWSKAKRYGLCQRSVVESTKKIVFSLGLIPFMTIGWTKNKKNKKDEKEELNNYLNEIKEFVKGLPSNYVEFYEKYLKFYEKSWIQNKYFNMHEIINKDFINRKNILCEFYHYKLSYSYDYFYPKLSSLVDKVKTIIKDYYKNADENGIKLPEGKKSLLEEVTNFFEEYQGNKKKQIKFSSLIELETDLSEKKEKININILKLFFGLFTIEGVENAENIFQNIYDYDEIEPILTMKYSQPQPLLLYDMKTNNEGQENININNNNCASKIMG